MTDENVAVPSQSVTKDRRIVNKPIQPSGMLSEIPILYEAPKNKVTIPHAQVAVDSEIMAQKKDMSV